VGKSLTDHCNFCFAVEQKASVNECSPPISNTEVLAKAREQFAKDGTGPFSYTNHNMPVGFFKDPATFATQAYQPLSQHFQDRCQNLLYQPGKWSEL